MSEGGKQSIVVDVPQTYPVKSLNNGLIFGFLTLGIESEFTDPASLKLEVLAIALNYDVDVRQFRTVDMAWLLRQI